VAITSTPQPCWLLIWSAACLHELPPVGTLPQMLAALVGLVVGLFRSRASLVAENELLRQQLAAAKCRLQGKRVMFTWLAAPDHRGADQVDDRVADRGSAGAARHCASMAPGGLPTSVARAVASSRPKADKPRRAHSRDGRAKPALGRRADAG
jgi:hypothetical protein